MNKLDYLYGFWLSFLCAITSFIVSLISLNRHNYGAIYVFSFLFSISITLSILNLIEYKKNKPPYDWKTFLFRLFPFRGHIWTHLPLRRLSWIQRKRPWINAGGFDLFYYLYSYYYLMSDESEDCCYFLLISLFKLL